LAPARGTRRIDWQYSLTKEFVMTRYVCIAAAALAMGVFATAGCKKEESAQNTNTTDNRTAGEKASDAIAKSGETAANAARNAADKTAEGARTAGEKLKAATQPSADKALRDARATLATCVEAALTHNGLSDMVERFSKPARDRIGKIDKDSLGDLNAAIGQFKNDWKAKYNQDFKLTDKDEVVFGSPVEVKVGDTGAARLAAARTSANDTGATSSDREANNVVTVTMPATADAPALALRLVNEGTVMASYKIEVPDSLTADQLRDALTQQVKAIDGMKGSWPSDVNEAYRIASQHILAATQAAK
jgi:hypothetical protein